ncbi:SOS-induced cell division inhibitor SulA [Enterobacter sp. HK-058-C-ECC]|uniref:SOS-induced cell division inhibitor SulA n=1 Tax=Enterobacter sp. HK-058-C-ECC TaxID=3397227 RepID=UPI0039DF393A
MHTSGYANRAISLSSAAGNVAQNSVERVSTGIISEVVYREDQPLLTQLLLLPLLQQLGQQSRWQLWLTPQQKLSREWVQSAGLPLTKVMQINQLSPCDTVESMIRALRTGNYSVVIGWLPEELTEELTEEEHFRLTEAAEEGNAIGFIMRPVRSDSYRRGQLSGLKIHSNLYH